MKYLCVLCSSLFLVSGCASTFSEVSLGPAETAPVPASTEAEVPVSLRWVRNSAEHRAVFLQTFRVATWALEAESAERAPGTWAVALDGDETVIDNSLYELERQVEGEPMTEESWDAWVRRKAAPPLPGVRAFLGRVRDLGGRIAIVTNRRQRHCAATEENFRLYGIPFDVMLCRTDTREKEPRWQRVEDGTASTELGPLEILMWIGDNIEDFPGLDQSLRLGGDDGFGAFGSRFVVVPNPLYGSFLDNPPLHASDQE